MNNFFLTINAEAVYIAAAPTLEILIGGVVVSSATITTGPSDYSFQLEFTGDFPSSLQFRFNDGSAEGGRSIDLNSVRINGQEISDTTYINLLTLNQNDVSTVNTAGADHLFGREEPTAGDLGAPTITGTGGNDNIDGTAGEDVIDGGAGHDRIRGLDSDDAITGGADDDFIRGGAGNDIIIGGTGDDYLIGDEGDDLIYGQDGNDRLSGNAGQDVLNGGAGDDQISGHEDNDILYGEDGGDSLFGGLGDDVLYGDGDRDLLRGDAGNDTIYGGADVDDIEGGTGNDTLYGGLGLDTIQGGTGTDAAAWDVNSAGFVIYRDNASYIVVKDTNDLTATGYGADRIYNDVESIVFNDVTIDLTSTVFALDGEGWGTAATLIGDANPNTLTGTAAVDTIFGRDGGDAIYGLQGDDSLHGEGGNDTLDAGAGDDFLEGGDGHDRLRAGDGDDTLLGGNGNDTLTGGAGDDIIDGGANTDSVVYSTATSGVTVSLLTAVAQNTGGGGIDTITNVENITGSDFNDTLTGDANNNTLNGLDGNDTIEGGAGNDFINGGDGNDVIRGGAGTDTLTYTGSSAAITVDLAIIAAQNTGGSGTDTITGIENLRGSGHDDFFSGDNGNNQLSGSSGNDTLIGRGGADRLSGGGGTDTADYSGAAAGIVADLDARVATDDGDGSADTLISIENVIGSGSDDIIAGSRKDNVLTGGGGNDTLSGAEGDDTLNGGAGTDTVDYSAAGAAVNANLTTGVVSADGDGDSDTLVSIENIIGSDFDDTITGSASTGTLTGGDGNDTITSGSVDTLAAQINAILTANPNVTHDATTGNFYEHITTNLRWNQADTSAKGSLINGVAGHIVHVTSAYENNMVDTLAGGNRIWGGGSDLATEGTWIWSGGILDGISFWLGNGSGSSQNGFYENWDANQPNNGGGGGGSDFLTIQNGGGWNDVRSTGGNRRDHVVEWEGSELLSPTSTTTIAGGDGLDELYGGAGHDIFLFEAASAFNDIDEINNYNVAHHDTIDISDLLTGFNPGTSDVDDFARFVTSGADLLLQVDANGAVGGANYSTVANLIGSGASELNIEEMTAAGFLVVA